jgi:hypothetical protein
VSVPGGWVFAGAFMVMGPDGAPWPATLWLVPCVPNGPPAAEAPQPAEQRRGRRVGIKNQKCAPERPAPLEELVRLAFEGVEPSRVAQRALRETVSKQDVEALLGTLDVVRAATSPFANYFLQEFVVLHPEVALGCLLKALETSGPEATSKVARHRFGCRVLCRVAERVVPGSEAEDGLVALFTGDQGSRVVGHEFGRHVAITSLEGPSPAARRAVLSVVWTNLWALAGSETGRLSLEKALDVDRELALELSKNPTGLARCLGQRKKGARFLKRAIDRVVAADLEQ